MKAGVLVGSIFGAASVFLFIFLLYTVHFNALGPDGVSIDNFDAISIQITILAVIVGAVALGPAVAAFFGYQALETVVLRRTESVVLKRADELWNQRLANYQTAQPPEGSGPPQPPAQVEEEQDV